MSRERHKPTKEAALPSMEKEAISFLISRAKNWLQMEYEILLWDKMWSEH